MSRSKNRAVWDSGTDVYVKLHGGTSLKFEDVGDGTMDSIYDLVDDPGQITTSWLT